MRVYSEGIATLGRGRMEDHTHHSTYLLVTDKEDACTHLAQLPCTSKQDTEELLIGMLFRIVTSKMSCAQVKVTERLSPRQT